MAKMLASVHNSNEAIQLLLSLQNALFRTPAKYYFIYHTISFTLFLHIYIYV